MLIFCEVLENLEEGDWLAEVDDVGEGACGSGLKVLPASGG